MKIAHVGIAGAAGYFGGPAVRRFIAEKRAEAKGYDYYYSQGEEYDLVASIAVGIVAYYLIGRLS